MRKLWILILGIFCLTSCQKANISDTLFIASIGIEQEEDAYYGYFYLPLSSDVGKSENTENKGKGDYAKVKGNSLAELFRNVKVTISLDINFRHVSSIVLNEKLLKKEFLEELADFIKYYMDIDYNIYLFVTKEKLEDIYDFQNPNQESVLNSLLVSTSDAKMPFLVAEPIHFLEFVRKFYADRSIVLPLLDIEELWTVDGNKVKNSYCQSAIYYYKGTVQEAVRNPNSPYVKSIEQFEDRINDISVCFYQYQVQFRHQEKLIIDCCFQYEVLSSNASLSNHEVERFVQDKIERFIEEFQEIDPFDLNYYNQVMSKNMSYDEVEIHVSIAKN